MEQVFKLMVDLLNTIPVCGKQNLAKLHSCIDILESLISDFERMKKNDCDCERENGEC